MEREQAGPPSWAWDSGPTEASRSALPEAGRNSSACSLAGGGPGSPPRLPTTGTPSCSSYCASLVGVHTDSTLPQHQHHSARGPVCASAAGGALLAPRPGGPAGPPTTARAPPKAKNGSWGPPPPRARRGGGPAGAPAAPPANRG